MIYLKEGNMDLKDIIVEKFGLDEESKERFIESYDNPFVDESLKEFIGEDYRFRTPLPRSLYKEFDRGWVTLKNILPDFIHKYDITYNDFYRNKKTHEKNDLKIIKLIRNYVNDKMPINDYHSFLINMRSYEEVKFDKLRQYCRDKGIDIGSFKSLNKALSLFIDRINELRFSKTQNIEIVLSLNYNDWFLSTTGETWRTCLSLESPSFASYWISLAGSVVDRNLSLLYITNGEKKSYLDFQMDKVLSRSWVLLDKKSTLNAVRFYPSEIIKVKDLSSFYPIPIKNISMSYRSKYRIHPLYFENGYTNYIYQDKTKPFNLEGDSFELHGGGKGLQTIYKGKVFEGPVFNYTDGLSNLINNINDINVLKFFKKPYTCFSCGELISSGRHIKKDRYDNSYCMNCNIKEELLYNEDDDIEMDMCDDDDDDDEINYDFIFNSAANVSHAIRDNGNVEENIPDNLKRAENVAHTIRGNVNVEGNIPGNLKRAFYHWENYYNDMEITPDPSYKRIANEVEDGEELKTLEVHSSGNR